MYNKVKAKVEERINNVEHDLNGWNKIKRNNGMNTETLVQYSLEDVEYHITFLKGYRDALMRVKNDLKTLEGEDSIFEPCYD